jgi:DUF4097 and DUF4098 domain-containing protein YvlB
MSDETQFNSSGIRSVAIRGHHSGSIDIHAADNDEVLGRLSATDGSYLESVSVSESGDRLIITFPQQRFSLDPDVDIHLEVPEETDLEVQTGSGDVRADVTLGAVRISTGSGDVDLTATARARVTSGSGDIVLGDVEDGEPEAGQNDAPSVLNSGSGDISVGSTSGPLQAKTASGDIHVLQLTGPMRANTASGDISIPQLSGAVDLRCASGDINVGVADQLPAWLELRSVSGDVNIDLDASEQPAKGEPYVAIKASTASGDISVYRA